MDQPGRLWLLHLVLPIRHGRPLTAVIIGLSLAALFGSVGLLTSGESSIELFFCAILAYIIPVFHFITERTISALQALYPLLDAEPEEKLVWEASIVNKGRRWTLFVSLIGALWFMGHVLLLFGSLSAWFNAAIIDPAGLASTLGMALVWIVMTTVVTALLDNARLFATLATRARIQLLNTHTLTPFAGVAVISTLVLIGAQAAFSVMWIGGNAPLAAFAPGLIATAIPMLVLFVLPIWPVHRAIVSAKTYELSRLNMLLDASPTPDPGDPEMLAGISPLLTYRREIRLVSEWPFNFGVVARLGFYLVIPPLTWVGAALIENGIEFFF